MNRHNTTPVPVMVSSLPAPAPASERRDVLGRGWKQLTSLAIGLSTVGALAWVVGKAFFVSREEYTQAQSATIRIEARLERIEAATSDSRGERAEVMRTLGDIGARLVRIEAKHDGTKSR